jgi:hypothetical protein
MSAPTQPSSNPRDLSTLIALLRSSNQGLCLDAANEIDRLLRDNVDLMKACTARMYSTHEPKNALDDKSLCDALTEALRHAFVPGMQTADGSPFQFVDLMSDPGTDISTGIDRIESFAENVTDEVMELLPQDSIVTDIKLRSIDEAERIYRAVQPPSAVPIRPYGEEVAPAGPWRVVRYGSPPDKGDMIFDERGCIAHFGEHHHEAVSRIVYEHNVSVMTHDKA